MPLFSLVEACRNRNVEEVKEILAKPGSVRDIVTNEFETLKVIMSENRHGLQKECIHAILDAMKVLDIEQAIKSCPELEEFYTYMYKCVRVNRALDCRDIDTVKHFLAQSPRFINIVASVITIECLYDLKNSAQSDSLNYLLNIPYVLKSVSRLMTSSYHCDLNHEATISLLDDLLQKPSFVAKIVKEIKNGLWINFINELGNPAEYIIRVMQVPSIAEAVASINLISFSIATNGAVVSRLLSYPDVLDNIVSLINIDSLRRAAVKLDTASTRRVNEAALSQNQKALEEALSGVTYRVTEKRLSFIKELLRNQRIKDKIIDNIKLSHFEKMAKQNELLLVEALLSYREVTEKIAALITIEDIKLLLTSDIVNYRYLAKMLVRCPAIIQKFLSTDIKNSVYQLLNFLVTDENSEINKEIAISIFEAMEPEEILQALDACPKAIEYHKEFTRHKRAFSSSIASSMAYSKVVVLPADIETNFILPMTFPPHYNPKLQKVVIGEARIEANILVGEWKAKMARKRAESALTDETYLVSNAQLPDVPMVIDVALFAQELPPAITFSQEAPSGSTSSVNVERISKHRRTQEQDDDVDVTHERRIAPVSLK